MYIAGASKRRKSLFLFMTTSGASNVDEERSWRRIHGHAAKTKQLTATLLSFCVKYILHQLFKN
jgi:hypothetical protein